MGYKMSGPLFFKSPAKQYKTPTIPSVNYDKDDQSKENAKKSGNTCKKCGKLKGNCTCKGSQHKVHRDGAPNSYHYKGSDGKNKKGTDNWQPHQF